MYSHAGKLVEDRYSEAVDLGQHIPEPRAAFRALLGCRNISIYGMGGDRNNAVFTHVGSVSLPESLQDSPELTSVAPRESHHFLGDMSRMLRPSTEISAPGFGEQLPTPYWDPVLRKSRAKRFALYRRLLSLGMLRAAPCGSGKSRVSVLFVKISGKKKVGMIVDARRTNAIVLRSAGRFFLQLRRSGKSRSPGARRCGDR